MDVQNESPLASVEPKVTHKAMIFWVDNQSKPVSWGTAKAARNRVRADFQR